MSKQVNNKVVVLACFDQEKAQLPGISMTEQPMLLTQSKTNRPGYKFSASFMDCSWFSDWRLGPLL